MNSKKLTHSFHKSFETVNSRLREWPMWAQVVSRAFIATTLGFLLSFSLKEPISMSTSAMFSSPEKRDFQMSDMFAQIADNRPVRSYDDRIVIVNIGNHNREEITEALSLLPLCGPKAVGIDINFADPGNNDEDLIETLESQPNLVLPLGVSISKENGEFKIEDKPFFFDKVPGFHYGVVNLPLSVNKGTIREYAVSFPTEIGRIPSFVSAMAQTLDPEAVKKIEKKNVETGVTAYHSREYKVINLEEIEENAENLADKIVLVGALGDSSDMHTTPIESHVPGIMLHASALSTVLDGVWYQKVPKYFDYIIAAMLCFLIMIVVFGFKKSYKGIFLRAIQAGLLICSVYVGYWLFIDHQIIFDLSYTVLIIAFGIFAADIWTGIEAFWNWCSKKAEEKDTKAQTQSQLC